MENYEFKSGEVIEILEKLLDDFKDEKADLDEEEVKKVAAHDGLLQEKTSLKKSKDKEYEDAKAEKASTAETITQKSGDLSTISATLLDDQEYLKDLHAKCEDKSKMWDSRTEVRSSELTALTQAIQIITDLASKKDSLLQITALVKFPKDHVVLVQDSRDSVLDHVKSTTKMEAIDDYVGFLQLGKPRQLLAVLSHETAITAKESSTESNRRQVVSLLRSKAKELRSGLLTRLADKVESDPFKKVRKLIEELIDRLIQEAKDEASHKGWCDEEMGKAKRTRSEKADEITKLNSKLSSAEALRDKLAEQVETLEKEIADLEADLEKQTKLREEEKAENEATIKEAEEARDAVKEAITVLKDFYEKQAKGASLIQEQKDLQSQDPPDAGFDGEYKGASDKAGGIIGMLEVIQSDFERTMSETETAEKQAEQDFMEFERTTKTSVETKKTAKEEKSAELERTETNISDDMDSLKAAQKTLEGSLKELQELHKACIDTGMTWEERQQAREEELAALKEALCILDRSGPVKSYDNC